MSITGEGTPVERLAAIAAVGDTRLHVTIDSQGRARYSVHVYSEENEFHSGVYVRPAQALLATEREVRKWLKAKEQSHS